MNRLPYDLLYSFLVFGESPSINVAARRLGLTQPALTKQLQRLEASLPQSPFMSRGRQKVLNKYGLELHKSVKNSIQALDLDLARIHHELDEFSITYKCGLRREVLERLADHLSLKNRIEFVFGQNDEILRKFHNGELDIAVSHTLPNTYGVVSKKLFSENFKLVAHKKLLNDKPLKRQAYNLEFLKSTPAIAYTKDVVLLSRWFKEVGMDRPIQPKIVCEDWTIIGKMVNLGNGYSVLPSGFKLIDEVETLDIPDHILKGPSFYLLYRKELKGTTLVQSFIPR